MTGFLRKRFEATRTRDESGAILVLALIFMVATALLITGLTAWEGNDIKNVGSLTSARNALNAADGAIQTAIANTRYEYPSSAILSSTGSFCPSSGSSQPSTNPFASNGPPIVVWCKASTNLNQCPNIQNTLIPGCSRTETLFAYPKTQCTSTSCSGAPYMESEIVFDDWSAQGNNDCSPTGTPTTCGSTMTVYSNVISESLS
jgi:hypothetical protein